MARRALGAKLGLDARARTGAVVRGMPPDDFPTTITAADGAIRRCGVLQRAQGQFFARLVRSCEQLIAQITGQRE